MATRHEWKIVSEDNNYLVLDQIQMPMLTLVMIVYIVKLAILLSTPQANDNSDILCQEERQSPPHSFWCFKGSLSQQ